MYSSEEFLNIKKRIKNNLTHQMKIEGDQIILEFNLTPISYSGSLSFSRSIVSDAYSNTSMGVESTLVDLIIGDIISKTDILKQFLTCERREKNLKEILG